MSRLLFVALFLEVGFVLVVVPWSAFWDRNYFADSIPVIAAVISNNYVRGAVTGIGLVNIAVGVAELFTMFLRRPLAHPDTASIAPRMED